MNHDLAVRDGDRPQADRQAGAIHDEFYERYPEPDDVVAPAVPDADADALVARHPHDAGHGAVRASPPVIDEASGPIGYLLISCGRAEEVSAYAAASEYAAAPTREHALVCFDPQGERLRP
ncbi:hypothetical protein [Streptomyces sp. NPDC059168]|uniref:hypothetical protein n=1 Tax=Streptomyces sp. NPDC059168 TaxID=3346753 RepID=UPI00369E34E2